jgi:hypothetical protein
MQSTAMTMFRVRDQNPGLSAFTKDDVRYLKLLPDITAEQVAHEFKARLGFDLSPVSCSRWSDRRRIVHEYGIGRFLEDMEGRKLLSSEDVKVDLLVFAAHE